MWSRHSDLQDNDTVGGRLSQLRRRGGLSRSWLAREAGLTRRRIAEIEAGQSPVGDDEIDALAEACGVTAHDLTPLGHNVTLVGGMTSAREVRGEEALDALLREYVAMVLELRTAHEIEPSSLRTDDLTELASALGGTPEAIEARLIELLGTDARGARELRAAMLPSSSTR